MSPREILARWGWTFPSRPLPPHIPPMPLGECFANAQTLVAHFAKTLTPLIYCEGFLLADEPSEARLHHAFCIDLQGTAIDPTWSYNPNRVYTGLPFRSWILPHYQRLHGRGYPLLGDLELRALSHAEYTAIAYCRDPLTGEVIPPKSSPPPGSHRARAPSAA